MNQHDLFEPVLAQSPVEDLAFFIEPPDCEVLGWLQIEALAPLSMVVAHPGTYYRSQARPSEHMLYSMLENALGWHFDDDAKVGVRRSELLKALKKAARKKQGRHSSWSSSDWLDKTHKPPVSGSGAATLLYYHLRFVPPHRIPSVTRFEDFWSQHLRDTGRSFFGGSRTYDYQLEELVTRTRAEDPEQAVNAKTKKRPPFIEMGDRKGFESLSLEDARRMERGKLNYTSVRSGFPQYFVSPKKREYVIPQGKYGFRVETTASVAAMLAQALDDPAAPLYLGTNDGWVDATWEVL